MGATPRRVQSGTLGRVIGSPENLEPPAGRTAAPTDLPGWVDLTEIDHVGVAVSDLEAAIAFHRDVLGLTLQHREDNPGQGVAEAMLTAHDGQPAVQLVAPLTPDSAVARFLDRRGPGLHHLAYRVPDLASASAVFRRRGLRLLYDLPRAGTRASLINFIHPKSTGGILIELVEVAATGQRHG
jgi:methylmalonyl-CoA/ethylmalonyl-CoA epimerase